MSQNDDNFQSKGKKFGGGGKGRGKPGGGGFKKRFEGDRGGFKGGGGKRFDRDGGGERKFEGRGGKPGYKGRDSGQSRDGGAGKPYEKREWKPREDRGGGEGGYKKRDFKPREDREGGYQKREWKPREGGRSEGGGDFKKREWKPREDRGGDRREGGYHQKRDFKPREDRGGDREGGYQKREWKPREGGRSEGGGDFKKREWKPREGGGDFKKREWKPREGGERRFVGGGEGHAGRKNYGAKTGKGDFDRRPRRARDFSIENDIAESEVPIATNSAETRSRLKSDRPSYGSPSSAFLYGVHAVTAALENPKRLHQRLLVTSNGYEAIKDTYEMAQGNGLKLPAPIYVESVDIERLLPRDAVHQGLLLDSQPLEEFFLADILLSAPDDAKILVLDQVTDPHNVGAILRSAAAFGAVAVVVQKIHAPEITGTLAKSASGAVEHIPVVREVNLTRAIEQLKEAGYFCIGLAEEGKATIAELHSSGKVALVLGAEGDGLRRLVAETCDTLAKLPTGGAISSLNVSNAAAVALYELIREA